MNLSVGIVGLPNVGKSTLFNSLLKKQVALVANYPFATIEPNIGVVEVPDERLPVLAKIVQTEKIVPAAIEFYDIAGLVKGASQGEGLGNQFLAKIREVKVIIHVVRLFANPNVAHVHEGIDPDNDISVVESELMLADLATLDKQGKDSPPVFDKIREALNRGIPVRNQTLSDDELELIKQLSLLTGKPVIYVFNVSESQLNQPSPKFEPNLLLSAKLEAELADFNPAEQAQILAQYKLEDTGLNRLIKLAYKTLGLISFLTAGKLEARAWTIASGTPAQEAAGVIHTDFVTNFIKADVIEYQDFVKAGGWVKAREAGLVKTVGRDYQLQDGQVVEFKIGT
ncbi:redox-regulated ATPase YchF [Patescibacteria group bacterium]|nr:redox-regulated ATPase YchF [Patescibacteria group bacterium]